MLKFTLLALLAQHPRHGYDLKVECDRALTIEKRSMSQPVNIGQIYATLQRMEQAGWVCSQPESGDGRERTVYEITEVGRKELADWLSDPVEPGNRLRDDFFVKLMVHQLSGINLAAEMIANQRLVYLQWLGELTKAKARLPEDAPPFSRLLLSYAIRHTKADLEWLDECETDLSG